ncbi:sulfite exporter TauE/SafE [Aureococcus anophagefferens]|nr:sulfite exporter TauE/SafE [Aureococcus anophagefferens]
MPGPPDLRVELPPKAVGAPPAPSPPSPPPSAPPSPKTPRLAAALAPYVGAWKVVWLISPASMREFLEERGVASRSRALMAALTQSSELEFGVDGQDNWTERDLMSLNLFHTNRVVIPINVGSSEGVTPYGMRCRGSVSFRDGRLQMVEVPADPTSAETPVTHDFNLHGDLLHRRVSSGSGASFTMVLARIDAETHHRSRVLQREVEKAPRTRGPLALMPAACFFPVWLYCMATRKIWRAVFSQFWPMSAAMVLGSFIAGSTPLGGGVVGFPVAVLVLRMEPAQGRDFSAMIQAVGMTSASYLILYLKPELVHVKLVSWSIAFGVLGCIVGFVVEVDPFAVNLTLTTYLLAFAVVYFYKNEIIEHYLPPLGCAKGPAPGGGAKGDALAELVRAEEAKDEELAPAADPGDDDRRRTRESIRDGLLVVSALVGGFVTAKLGSGSDSMAYIFASFCWNMLTPEDVISESAMTASTVIVMATMSFVVMGIRMATGHVSQDVVYCWCAAAPWSASRALGSLVLGPRAELMLRRFFYFISVIQFLFFALIVIQTHAVGWSVVAVCIGATVAAVVAHYRLRLLPAATARTRQGARTTTRATPATRPPKRRLRGRQHVAAAPAAGDDVEGGGGV